MTSTPLLFGNYELVSWLGRGGMAEVCLAKVRAGPRAGSLVAIKRLLPHLADDPDCLDLFTTEADLARMIRHPNIVEVVEAGALHGIWFIAQEYVDGPDLGRLIALSSKSRRLLPVEFALAVSIRVLEALHHAHEARSPTGHELLLVHGDVSPSNVYLSRAGAVKLGDFGVARIRALDPRDDDALVWGKLAYLAPERLAGGSFDRRSDVWSAGVLLYELLTNRRPFESREPAELKAAIREARRPLPMGRMLPAGLESVVMRALGRRPEDRPATARALADALRPYASPSIDERRMVAEVVEVLSPESGDGFPARA